MVVSVAGSALCSFGKLSMDMHHPETASTSPGRMFLMNFLGALLPLLVIALLAHIERRRGRR